MQRFNRTGGWNREQLEKGETNCKEELAEAYRAKEDGRVGKSIRPSELTHRGSMQGAGGKGPSDKDVRF